MKEESRRPSGRRLECVIGALLSLAAGTGASAQEGDARSAEEDRVGEMIVTGTYIRGVEDRFSPVISVSRDRLDLAGVATVADFIDRLPQNFGGEAGTTLDQNSMGARAVNLRGLGTEATLTLLNGRRLSPGGVTGEYIDISSIPTAALERVDVLTDGASAIYGSDAIAGVVNFVLRRDYDGSETRLRFGGATEGSRQEMQAAHTIGVTGERGRLLFSYEYADEDELHARDREFTRTMPDPNELLPHSERHSAFFSGGLNVGAHAEIFSDIYYHRRDSDQTYQSFDRRDDDTDVEQIGGTLGATIDFTDDWRLEVSGSWAQNDFYNSQLIDPHPPIYVGQFQESETRVWSGDVRVDGALFDLPGGAARVVVGAQYRDEKHDGGADFFNADGDPIGNAQVVAHKTRDAFAAFTEFYLPFVSSGNARPGVQQLSLSLAGRYEEYSDFGSTFNPKVGLLWSPVQGFTLRGSYGTSFRAPRLQQMVDQVTTVILADYIDPEAPEGMSVAAWVSGSKSDLDPEESTSWTAGFDFEPAWAEGLRLRATYFDIDYEGRIEIPQPLLSGVQLHSYPLPPRRGVTAADIEPLLAIASFPLINFTMVPGGSQSTLDDVEVMLDSRATNTSRSRASGIDLDISYTRTNETGGWQYSLIATYLLESEDQFSVLRPVVDKLNTVGNPVDLRATASIGWSHNANSLGLFVNYVDGYRDIQSLSGSEPIGSWTTVDVSWRYDFDRRFSEGFLSGTVLTLSVLNAFDRNPPDLPMQVQPGAGARLIPYDVANADPDGRMVALQVTKRW